MLLKRALPLILLCAAPVGPAALAALPVTSGAPSHPLLVDVQARKGTRNYVPDGTGTSVSPQAQPSSDALEQCMSTWDAGTHITQAKWREICKRQLKERDEMASPYSSGSKSTQ